MNPFVHKLIIRSPVYDSFIYKRKLYLLTQDNFLLAIDWVDFISKLGKEAGNDFGYYCSFCKSDYLYHPQYAPFLQGEAIREAIQSVMSDVRDDEFVFGEGELKKYCSTDAPRLAQTPIDLLVYKDTLFYLYDDGLYARDLVKNRRVVSVPHFVRSEALLRRGKFVSLAKGYGSCLLLSALDDGLYAFDLSDEGQGRRLEKLCEEHSSFVGKDYSSFLSGSYTRRSFFFGRKWDEKKRVYLPNGKRDVSTIFHRSDGVYFSQGNVLYCVSSAGIDSVDYTQNSFSFSEPHQVYNRSLNPDDLVSAQGTVFGFVLEFSDHLLVLLSDDSSFEIPFPKGALVNWRVFPESIDYENHLHLDFADRLEIYSFNQDPFIEQRSKQIGSRFPFWQFTSVGHWDRY